MQYTMKPFEALTNLELYKLLQLRQEIFIIEQDCIYPDIDDKDQAAHHLLAYEGDKPVGCLRVLGEGVSYEGAASIGRVVVHEAYRGRGIAKEMMLQALAFIRAEMGDIPVKISAQTYAIAFYESVGFEVMGEAYLEDGIPHVGMVCGS